jgi:FkbM family methyltransferase
MNKYYFKRPLYYIAGKVSTIMISLQYKLDKKKNIAKSKSWDKLFDNNSCFEFNLNKNVKINLYKDSVLSRCIYDGFEEAEIEYLTNTLTKGDIFVDIGANIGLFSLIASKIVGIEGKVLCFEPAPLTYSRLDENLKLNKLQNVDSRNIGLSDKKGELMFYVSNNGYDAWNSFAPSQDNKLESSIKVPVSTLDSELLDINKSKIKLVKIDVEGWEKFVLFGGKDFFENFSPIVMIEFTEENTFNAGYAVHDIYNVMQDFGYVWHRITKGELIKEDKKLHYPYDNLIAIKNKF